MDKSNRNNSTSKLKYAKEAIDLGIVEVDSESNQAYTKEVTEAKTIKLQSRYDARLRYEGQVTGKLYTWNKAGDVVEVDSLDSEYLLAKRVGAKPCCGNSRGGNPIFEISN